MSCPTTDIKNSNIQKLTDYINNNLAVYKDSFQRYLTLGATSTSATLVNNTLNNSNKVNKIVTLVNATSAMELVVNGRTVYIPLLSAI